MLLNCLLRCLLPMICTNLSIKNCFFGLQRQNVVNVSRAKLGNDPAETGSEGRVGRQHLYKIMHVF
jgi:hypothetical protein